MTFEVDSNLYMVCERFNNCFLGHKPVLGCFHEAVA